MALTTERKQVMIKEALLREAEERIDDLERQVNTLKKQMHGDEDFMEGTIVFEGVD